MFGTSAGPAGGTLFHRACKSILVAFFLAMGILYIHVRRERDEERKWYLVFPKNQPSLNNQSTIPKELNNIFYLHVPKCGSSFSTVLVQYACPSFPKNRVVGPPSLLEFPVGQRMDYIKFCGNRFKRFRSGHAPLPSNLSSDFNATIDVVTFLRNPLDRIISGFLNNFHDCYMGPLATKYTWLFPSTELKDIMPGGTSPNYTALFSNEHRKELQIVYRFYWNCVKGCATRMVLGEPCGNNISQEKKSLTTVDVKVAIERIQRFAFVGLNDRWADSMALWECMFGGEYSKYILINTRPSANSPLKVVLYKLANSMHLLDEADTILFDYAQIQFAYMKQKYCGIGRVVMD